MQVILKRNIQVGENKIELKKGDKATIRACRFGGGQEFYICDVGEHSMIAIPKEDAELEKAPVIVKATSKD